MTTAARPTWAPAKGGNEQGGTRIFGPSQKYSSRDLASHTSLKPRKEGQDTQDELQKRNLREELEERERRHFSSKDKSYTGEAEAILIRSQATAQGLKILSEVVKAEGGVEAANLRVAKRYITAFGRAAKERTTLLLLSAIGNSSSMIAPFTSECYWKSIFHDSIMEDGFPIALGSRRVVLCVKR